MMRACICLFLLIVCCWLAGRAQLKKFSAAAIEQEVVKVNDSLYAFRCETSNFEYAAFLAELAGNDSALYPLYLVDSVKWLEVNFGRSGAMAMHYHRHPGFADYPVVCISYEGALAYCNWLTRLYNDNAKRVFDEVRFVLPSEQEWEQAAQGSRTNLVYPWGSRSLRDLRKGSWQGQFMANFRRLADWTIVSDSSGNPVMKRDEDIEPAGLSDGAFYTAEVRSFMPNSIGIYNQSGNVAEMTIEKGLTKGGSWNSFGGEIAISYRLYFPEPSPEVGFRVFMKIIKR